MEVSKLTINNKQDDTRVAILKYIKNHPETCRSTTAYRIARAVSLTTGIPRKEVSLYIRGMVAKGAIYSIGGFNSKLRRFSINENYPGVKQTITLGAEPKEVESIPEETDVEPEEPVDKQPEIEKPVELSVDGQTITINLTINLRR